MVKVAARQLNVVNVGSSGTFVVKIIRVCIYYKLFFKFICINYEIKC